MQTAQDLIWSVDEFGRWTFVNDAARRIYGFEPEQMLGRHFTDFAAAEQIAADRASLEAIAATRQPFDFESIHLRANGDTVHLRFHGMALVDDAHGVIGATGTAADITVLRAMQDGLVQSQRMQALGTLTGGIAHDINNMLTTVLGYSDLVRRRVSDEPQCGRDLDTLDEVALRGRAMTDQLLAFGPRASHVRGSARRRVGLGESPRVHP